MDFRYPPNHHLPEDSRFGQSDTPTWSGPDDPDPERRAARIQDQASRIVRLRLKADGISQSQFAAKIGMDRPKVSRLLTGAMWASLIDLEMLLGGCGATLTSVSLAIGDGSHQSTRVKKIISSYLREQLEKVEEETPHTGQGHPSTSAPQQPEGLA